ncbi:MAG: Rid family hydrolase [Verrucomicrobiota bacterium]
MIGFLREFDGGEVPSAPSPHSSFNPNRALKQHVAYVKLIRKLGLDVEWFTPSGNLETLFLCDEVLLLPEVAVVGSVLISAQKKESAEIIAMMANHRPVQRLGESGLLDGGDVLRIGRTLYVAQSQWTNNEGISDLRDIVKPFGYEVRVVELRGGRNLDAACTHVPPHFLVFNPAWVDASAFENCHAIPVDESEPLAANTLTLADTTLVSASFPKTEARLREAGIKTQSVNISEFEKIGGRLTRFLLIKEPRETRTVALSSSGGLKEVHAAQVPAPIGHASQAIVHGGTVYVSAQRPFDPSVENAPRMPIEEQAEQVLKNLAAVLSTAASSLSNVLHATVHLADPKHLERIEPVYAHAFADHRPTRTIISNRALPAGVLIEIEVVAAVAKGPLI